MRDQWNEPSRTDYYLMLVAMEVARKLAKSPGKIQLKHFRIKFQEAAGGDPEKAKKFAAELSRARLMAMVDAARRKKERGRQTRLKEPTRKRLDRERREREGKGTPPQITRPRRRPPKPELRAPSPRK